MDKALVSVPRAGHKRAAFLMDISMSFLSGFMLVAISNCAWTQPKVALDPVIVAAQRRQQLFKTVYLEFKRTDIDAVGAVSEMAGNIAHHKSPVPTKET